MIRRLFLTFKFLFLLVLCSQLAIAQSGDEISEWKRNALKAVKSDFQFKIDEIFSIDGEGQKVTVIFGNVLKGKAETNDFLEIPLKVGSKTTSKLLKIEMYDDGRKELDVAYPGDWLALHFANPKKSEVEKAGILKMHIKK